MRRVVSSFITDKRGNILGVCVSVHGNIFKDTVLPLRQFAMNSMNDNIEFISFKSSKVINVYIDEKGVHLYYDGARGGKKHIEDIKKINILDTSLSLNEKQGLIYDFEDFTGKTVGKETKMTLGIGYR